MADRSNTDEIQIVRFDPEFHRLYNLFPGFPPPGLLGLHHNNLDELCTKFGFLSGAVPNRIPSYADLGASSSSIAEVLYAHNGTYCTFPNSSDKGIRHNSHDRERKIVIVMSNSPPDYANCFQSHLQWLEASFNYPTGHGGAVIVPTDGNSLGRPWGFTVRSCNSLADYADHIQSYSPRPIASIYNPPGQGEVVIIPCDGVFTSGHPGRQGAHGNSLGLYNPPSHDGVVINIPTDGDGEFTGGHRRILAEARAIIHDEAAGYSDFFNALFPATLTIAYEAHKTFKSTYNSTVPPAIKTFGYLATFFACFAVFSSLVGLNLCTFKPNTLPFGCTPRRMMQIMRNAGVHTTAYAFIGTMSHQFLQDDPFIMWMVGGLASAIFMSLMVVIGKRR